MTVEISNIYWNNSTNPYLQSIEIVKNGDSDGYGMVFRIKVKDSKEIFAIALPHNFPTRTGPTWAYLLENNGWTLIDAGPPGSLEALKSGLNSIGKKVTDIEHLIISHGHQDHDGNVYHLLESSGAELWAHELYFLFMPYEQSRTGLNAESILHNSILSIRNNSGYSGVQARNEYSRSRERYQAFADARLRAITENFKTHPIIHDEKFGDLRFLYTPGHAIDEICIDLKGVLFSGDHILPQITPHPTIIKTYPREIIGVMPEKHSQPSEHYGLHCYIKSLATVLKMDRRKTVMPAHRLFNDNKFNIRNLLRSKDIINHHARRLSQIISSVKEGADTPAKITMSLFPPGKLTGSGFFAALSEMVSHLEMLENVGDIKVLQDGIITTNGTRAFVDEINNILQN